MIQPSECHAILFPGEVSSIIVSDVDFHSLCISDGENCEGAITCLNDSDSDLREVDFNDRTRSFHMAPIPSSGSPRNIDVDVSSVSTPDKFSIDKRTSISCIQLCKDVYRMNRPDDSNWDPECHTYCHEMEVCTNTIQIDMPLHAINPIPSFDTPSQFSKAGTIILFDQLDCHGASALVAMRCRI